MQSLSNYAFYIALDTFLTYMLTHYGGISFRTHPLASLKVSIVYKIFTNWL